MKLHQLLEVTQGKTIVTIRKTEPIERFEGDPEDLLRMPFVQMDKIKDIFKVTEVFTLNDIIRIWVEEK